VVRYRIVIIISHISEAFVVFFGVRFSFTFSSKKVAYVIVCSYAPQFNKIIKKERASCGEGISLKEVNCSIAESEKE
jgi:hypothetical protein